MVTKEAVYTRRRNINLSEDQDDCMRISAVRGDMTVSAFIRQAVENECDRSREASLAKAAESLMDLYENDKELTAFTAIDGDDFL